MHGLVLAVHIGAGTTALAAGTGALIYRKGGADHGRWGTWFFGAMLVMAGLGAAIAASKPDRPTTLAGIITVYLVATSWLAIRRRDGVTGRAELGAFLFALACCLAGIGFGQMATASTGGVIDGYPPAICHAFAGLAGLCAALDLNALARRRLEPAQRIARHLWRMCVAFFLAAASLFLGQQDDVFWFMQGSPLLFIPPFATLFAMAYWLLRMRFGRGLAPRTKERPDTGLSVTG